MTSLIPRNSLNENWKGYYWLLQNWKQAHTSVFLIGWKYKMLYRAVDLYAWCIWLSKFSKWRDIFVWNCTRLSVRTLNPCIHDCLDFSEYKNAQIQRKKGALGQQNNDVNQWRCLFQHQTYQQCTNIWSRKMSQFTGQVLKDLMIQFSMKKLHFYIWIVKWNYGPRKK